MTSSWPANGFRLAARRRQQLTAVLAVTALVLVGCSSKSSKNDGTGKGGPHRGGTLTLLAPADPGSVDPAINYGTFWAQLILTNDGLLAFKKVGGVAGTEIVPDLATDVPTATDGGKTYEFHLRKGIKYSDGSDLKASDFKNTIERMFKVNGPTTVGFYSVFVGADKCLATPATCDLSPGIVTDDAAGTITVHLNAPDPEFFDKLALPFAFVVPPNSPNTDAGTKPLGGTGPYMFAEYTSGRQVVLKRNPHFKVWSKDAQPDGYPDSIVLKLGLDLEAAVTQVENGQADGIINVPVFPPDRLNEISTKYAAQTHVNPATAIFFMTQNVNVAPFNNLQVRQAVNFATDRNALVKIVGGAKLAVPSCQVLPPNFPGYEQYCPYTINPASDGKGPWTGPDLAKAQALVDASGTKGMQITIVNPTIPQAQSFGLYFVGLLNKLGYKASQKLLSPPVADAFVKNSRNKVQMNLQVWYQDYPAASDFLNVLTGCGSFHPNSDANANVAEFCDKTIQAKMDKALALQSTDPAAANALWAEVDRDVTDAAPLVVAVNPKTVTFVSKRVQNFLYNPQWFWLLSQSWVK